MERILKREDGTSPEHGNPVGRVWARILWPRPWTIKACQKTSDARAVLVSCADSGDIGPGIGASAQRRQKYDQVSPPRFPSAVAFAQTDRSCHDLAATA